MSDIELYFEMLRENGRTASAAFSFHRDTSDFQNGIGS
jgi:hypothetical protein